MTFKRGNDGSVYPTASSASSTDFGLVSKTSSNGRQVLKQVALQGFPGTSMLDDQPLVSAGTYGDAFNIPQITISEKGIITNVEVTAGGITSVNSLTNVSAPSPTNEQGLIFTSGQWIATSAILLSSNVGALAFDNTVSAATLDATGVSAGNYGTTNLVPQIQVDANGRITSITEVTVAGTVTGGTVVSSLTDVLDVSASSLADGDILVYDLANAEWNPQQQGSFYTSAQVSTRVQEILTSGGYTTSADVSTIVEGYNYYTSAQVSTRVQEIITSGGYITSAITTAQVSSLVETYGYITEASASSQTQGILDSGAYLTSASVGDLAFLNTITSSGLINANAVDLTDLAQVSAMKALGNITGATADVTLIDILDEDNMASNSDTAMVTQQSLVTFVNQQISAATGGGSGGGGSLLSVEVFTSTSTFTLPTSANRIEVIAVGAGGGGGAADLDNSAPNGNTGGTTSFGAYCSCSGGQGGRHSDDQTPDARGGPGGGSNIAAGVTGYAVPGGDGTAGTGYTEIVGTQVTIITGVGGTGGGSYFATGGRGGSDFAGNNTNDPGDSAGTQYGAGGGGGARANAGAFDLACAAGGGGAGGSAFLFLDATSVSSTVLVTIGASGGGGNGNNADGGNGAGGIVIVKSFE